MAEVRERCPAENPLVLATDAFEANFLSEMAKLGHRNVLDWSTFDSSSNHDLEAIVIQQVISVIVHLWYNRHIFRGGMLEEFQTNENIA